MTRPSSRVWTPTFIYPESPCLRIHSCTLHIPSPHPFPRAAPLERRVFSAIVLLHSRATASAIRPDQVSSLSAFLRTTYLLLRPSLRYTASVSTFGCIHNRIAASGRRLAPYMRCSLGSCGVPGGSLSVWLMGAQTADCRLSVEVLAHRSRCMLL